MVSARGPYRAKTEKVILFLFAVLEAPVCIGVRYLLQYMGDADHRRVA
jgi:hypothetical protein